MKNKESIPTAKNRKKLIIGDCIFLLVVGPGLFSLGILKPDLFMPRFLWYLALGIGGVWIVFGLYFVFYNILRRREHDCMTLKETLDNLMSNLPQHQIKRATNSVDNEFRYGSGSPDIAAYLQDYSADCYPVDVTKAVACLKCGSEVFTVMLDPNGGVIQVKCESCGHARFLLDSEEYWQESEPHEVSCPKCNGNQFNLSIGLMHRDDGSIKWVYAGCRCVKCSLLGCLADWKMNYGPADEAEKNI